MKLKTKFQPGFPSKYDLFIALLIVAALLIIGVIWTWYGHNNEEIENQIYRLK